MIDKSLLGLLVAGIPYMFDRAGLDIAQGKILIYFFIIL
jgi:hypothetical protein